MSDPLASARAFMTALENKDPEGAASVCADDVVIDLPGGDNELKGKDGARQLMARRSSPVHHREREWSIVPAL